MHPVIEQLLILQEIDIEIMNLEKGLSLYPGMRKIREDELSRTRRMCAESEANLKTLQVKIRSAESEAAELQEGIKKSQEQMHYVKVQKEYDALKLEISEREEKISEVDEIGLLALEKCETLEEKYAEQKQSLEVKENEARVELERIDAREQEKTAQLQTARERRKEQLANIDPAALNRYERLKELLAGTCVVPVQQGNCGGCHLKLLAHRLAEVFQDDMLNECDSCHRFLYVEES